MQFLHIVASHANILRASSRVGEERCDKALRTLHGGKAIHCPYCSLDSIQLLFRKMPEPAFTPPPHFPLQRSSLVGEDQRPDQGDGWHRAYSPYVSAGTKWEKLLNNEKISKGLFVVSVQLVAVLSDSSLKVWWRTHPAMTLCHSTMELLFTTSHRARARVPWIEVSQSKERIHCMYIVSNQQVI